jgi:hypothetical protein
VLRGQQVHHHKHQHKLKHICRRCDHGSKKSSRGASSILREGYKHQHKAMHGMLVVTGATGINSITNSTASSSSSTACPILVKQAS